MDLKYERQNYDYLSNGFNNKTQHKFSLLLNHLFEIPLFANGNNHIIKI